MTRQDQLPGLTPPKPRSAAHGQGSRREEASQRRSTTPHHDRRCGRTWTGLAEAHCTNCHAHFATTSAFDIHLNAQGCTPPGDIRSKRGEPRLEARNTEHGITWTHPPAAERPQHWQPA